MKNGKRVLRNIFSLNRKVKVRKRTQQKDLGKKMTPLHRQLEGVKRRVGPGEGDIGRATLSQKVLVKSPLESKEDRGEKDIKMAVLIPHLGDQKGLE